jgi:hypothetical protein
MRDFHFLFTLYTQRRYPETVRDKEYAMRFIYSPSICIVLVFLVMSGCTSLSSYTQLTSQSRISISQGKFADALTIFPERSAKGRNEILIRMERAVILQAMGSYELSANEFNKAVEKIKDYENRAVVSATRTTSQVGSLVINEQVQPYEGEDFEKVLIHGLGAVNYLMMGDLEGARVEIRNAYTRQKELYNKHERELERAKKDEGTAGWDRSFQEADKEGYDRLKKKALSVESIYQNAFAYYISSLVYELNDEPDEAYIDLKKAIQAAPDSESIQKDLIRLSKDLNFFDDIDKWESKYGKAPKSSGDLVDIFVIFSLGLAPYKEAVSFPIPVRKGGIVFASLPVYQYTPSSTRSAVVVYDGERSDATIVSDMDAIASKNLLDKFPILFAKQVARTYLKARATSKLSEEYGGWGALAGTLASAITEQADLRTWSSLPKEIQVARVFTPVETRRITIRSRPAGFQQAVEIPEGTRHLIVLCRATDAGLSIQTRAY